MTAFYVMEIACVMPVTLTTAMEASLEWRIYFLVHWLMSFLCAILGYPMNEVIQPHKKMLLLEQWQMLNFVLWNICAVGLHLEPHMSQSFSRDSRLVLKLKFLNKQPNSQKTNGQCRNPRMTTWPNQILQHVTRSQQQRAIVLSTLVSLLPCRTCHL